MVSRKQLLFLSIAFISFILLPLFVWFTTRSTEQPTPRPTLPSPTIAEDGNKIEISGIKMNNFLANPKEINVKGDALFAETQTYRFVYLKQFDEFLITILSSPFTQARIQSEKAFLNILGITQKEACHLKVSINTPQWVNPEESAIRYQLSFCE